LFKKKKNMLVSTQTGFEMIKSRLCVGALMTGLCLKAKQYYVPVLQNHDFHI
jgi:hypothetical protein